MGGLWKNTCRGGLWSTFKRTGKKKGQKFVFAARPKILGGNLEFQDAPVELCTCSSENFDFFDGFFRVFLLLLVMFEPKSAF